MVYAQFSRAGPGGGGQGGRGGGGGGAGRGGGALRISCQQLCFEW